MFAKFRMSLDEITAIQSEKEYKEYYNLGSELYNEQKKSVYSSLNKYLSTNGALKAAEIETDWFPNIKADVFLSHSHKDEKDVITLAGLLKEMGVTAFIDSCVWGYANDLLKQIDNTYCVQTIKSNGQCIYDYDLRNYSTAHVHMILNSALAKMIDATECLIFLDTPNSLEISSLSNGVTNSCWIYSELLYSKLLRERQPIRKSMTQRFDESFEHNALNVEYDVDLSHLIILKLADIISAYLKAHELGYEGKYMLDQLYYDKKLYKRR